MESLDADFFGEESSKRVSLLPDGTICHVARYGWCREQVWYCFGLLVISPVLIVLMALGSENARSVSLVLFWIFILGLIIWHAFRYRRYMQQIQAGCHMHGIFLFAATRDVVIRFHRAVGTDIEASISRDSLLAIELKKQCFQECLIIQSRGPSAPPKLVVPASWLIDSPSVVKRSLERHLDLGYAGGGINSGSVISPYHSYLEGDQNHHHHSTDGSHSSFDLFAR